MAPLAPQFRQPCKGSHLSNNCHVVTDAIARKEFLRNGDRCFLCLGQGHIGKNCQKSKRCFYCTGSHNSAICENKITKNYMAENSETTPQQIIQQIPAVFCYKLLKSF